MPCFCRDFCDFHKRLPCFFYHFCHDFILSLFLSQSGLWVTVNFMLKFPDFPYHGNRGLSVINFNGTLKLCNLDNPLFDAMFFVLPVILMKYTAKGINVSNMPLSNPVIHALILTNYVLKFPSFRRYGNKGRFGANFSDTIKLLCKLGNISGSVFSQFRNFNTKLVADV